MLASRAHRLAGGRSGKIRAWKVETFAPSRTRVRARAIFWQQLTWEYRRIFSLVRVSSSLTLAKYDSIEKEFGNVSFTSIFVFIPAIPYIVCLIRARNQQGQDRGMGWYSHRIDLKTGKNCYLSFIYGILRIWVS